MNHNYSSLWAETTEPDAVTTEAGALRACPQQEKSVRWKACVPQLE